MPANSESSRVYSIFGFLATLISVVALFSLAAVRSQGDITLTTTSTQTVNQAPTAESLFISDRRGVGDISKTGFVPNEGGYKTLFVRGKILDPNGCSDVRAVEVKVYRSGVGNLCAENFNNCYATTTESFINCGKNETAWFEVGLDIKYYAEPTDAGSQFENQYWFAEATAIDWSRVRYTAIASFEMNSLAALSAVTSTVSFGTVPLGGVSNEARLELMNAGNRNILGAVRAKSNLKSNLPGFVQVSSTNVHISLSKGFAYDAGFPLQTSSDIELPVGLTKQFREGAIETFPVYLRLKLPETGLSGVYSNELIFTAKAY